jgi:DNA-binding CsgD family transcriptional regulator
LGADVDNNLWSAMNMTELPFRSSGAYPRELIRPSADHAWIGGGNPGLGGDDGESDGLCPFQPFGADLSLGQLNQLAQMAMDGLSAAIFIMDARRRIVLANREGQKMLVPGSRLCLSNGMLSSPVAAEAAKMAQAVQKICTGLTGRVAMVLEETKNMPPLQLVLSRISGNSIGGGGSPWVLLLAGPSTPPPQDVSMLQMMFGLTPREAQTVADLAQGCSVEESATRRSVALSTARSQLNSALAKTRAGTQAKLMLMLRALPALAGTTDGGKTVAARASNACS